MVNYAVLTAFRPWDPKSMFGHFGGQYGEKKSPRTEAFTGTRTSVASPIKRKHCTLSTETIADRNGHDGARSAFRPPASRERGSTQHVSAFAPSGEMPVPWQHGSHWSGETRRAPSTGLSSSASSRRRNHLSGCHRGVEAVPRASTVQQRVHAPLGERDKRRAEHLRTVGWKSSVSVPAVGLQPHSDLFRR